MKDPARCSWVGDDRLMIAYHDEEWGVPLRDDRRLFEFLILDGAQAGLSWRTILHRREGYRHAFAEFDPDIVGSFDGDKVEQLLTDPGIVRNRAKVRSAIQNARAFLEIQNELGSFARYLWAFVEGEPIVHRFRHSDEIPAETDLSRLVSEDLKGRGFSFVGPTIVYALLQSAGLVNDHLVGCFRHSQVQQST